MNKGLSLYGPRSPAFFLILLLLLCSNQCVNLSSKGDLVQLEMWVPGVHFATEKINVNMLPPHTDVSPHPQRLIGTHSKMRAWPQRQECETLQYVPGNLCGNAFPEVV